MAEQARLARFFQTINKHRKALDLAIEEDFGGTLDPAEWRSAFESTEPRRGQLGFTVPLFAGYLTENHPLETFEENA
jgi:hypothetical protein